MSKRLLVLALVAMLSPVALGETVIVDDHFDDGDVTTNTTGIGTGFNYWDIGWEGNVTEADSKVTLNGPTHGGSRCSIVSKEGAGIGSGISRFKFQDVSFAVGNTSAGATARDCVGVKEGNETWDYDTGLPTGFWIQFENTSLTTSDGTGGWNGTSVLFYESSTDVKTVLATWSFDTLNWYPGAQNLAPVLDLTLDISSTSYSLTIGGDSITLLSGAMSGNLPFANELTTGYASAYIQSENPGIDILIDQIIIMEDVAPPVLASLPSPIDEGTDVRRDVVLSWTPGIYADTHNVYFGTDFNDVNDANLPGLIYSLEQSQNYYPTSGTLALDLGQTYYWKVDEVNDARAPGLWEGEVWQFTTEPYAYPLPSDRIDANASSYTAGKEPENTIDGSGLDANDMHSTATADMWQSGTESPGSAWLEYEFDKVYKLHEMWIWNYNGEYPLTWYGLKEVVIEYSTDGDSYTTLGTTHIFNEATGEPNYVHNTTIDMAGVAAKYVRITANSNHSTGAFSQYGLSEVRFFYIPMRAREPDPDDGQANTPIDVTLEWRAGREAAQHKLYMSTDEQAVIDETVAPNTISADSSYGSYGPLSLDLGNTYYWKVNEVNTAETPTTWQGDVWQFSTPEYLVVDNMNSYGDAMTPGEPGSRIYYVWRDGWDVTDPPLPGNDTGSQVYHWNGEGTDFMESTIVHSGVSMPYYYENDGETESKPIGGYYNSDLDYYSEATASTSDLPIGTNWNKAGVESMVIWFYGDPNNDANATEQMYVKLNGSKVEYDGDMDDIKEPSWHEWNIDLADFGINLSNVTSISIGFGDEDNEETPGGAGIVYFDDIRLYPPRCVPSLKKPDSDLDNDCDVDYDDLQIMVSNWLISNYTVTPQNPGTGDLEAYYDFEGDYEDSANDYDGEPNGGVSIIADGTRGNVASFDGNDGYVDLPIDSLIGTMDNATVMTWVNFGGGEGGWQRIFDFGSNTTVYMFLTPRIGTDGAMRFAITTGGGGTAEEVADAPETLPSGWHHVAVSIDTDNDTISLYLDGLLVGENTDANIAPSDLGETTNNWIGRSQWEPDAYLLASLDDFRIYSRALSQGEVAWMYGLTEEFTQPLYLLLTPENPDIDAYIDGAIDFKDFAALAADAWLEEPQLWP